MQSLRFLRNCSDIYHIAIQLDTMALSLTIDTDNLTSATIADFKKVLYEHWLKDAPKLIFGEHQLFIELDEVDEFFTQKAKEELRETPEIVAESFKELKKLLAEEPDLYLPDIEEFYTTFLRPCKWYPRSAFSLIKRFYRFHQTYSYIYKDLLPSKEKAAICSGLIFPLPLRTKEGCRLIVIEGGKRWKPKEVSLNEFFRGIILMFFVGTAEYRTQIGGAHVILDLDDLPLSHLTYVTPTFARMIVEFVQKCVPLRVKGIHIVNQPFIFKIGFAIFKPFLEEKLRKRIHVHGTNWNSLMTFINKEALLKRYGGELEMPEGQYGVPLWQNILYCEPILEAEKHYGYINKEN